MRTRQTNLRPHGASFIGRESALTRLDALLASGARLVTVQGPGGVGKTRLATEYARLRADRYPGGTWLCELIDARDRVDITRAVARALDLAIDAGATEEQMNAMLGRAISARGATLIVFDNFDRVVAFAEDTVGKWVGAAPDLHAIATSRAMLRVGGEALLDLTPLQIVAEEGAMPEAVQLFVDRARSVREGAWGASAMAAIIDIVSQLDGLPLAVELAAGRMGVLSPEDLQSRLGTRLDILADPPGNPARRSLAETILGSWELLEPWEQAALAQCSTFRGGFGAQSAEAVLALDNAPSVVDVLHALREKSLIAVATTTSEQSDPTYRRFTLYESIRQFAAEKLKATGDEQPTCVRQAAHFAKIAVAWFDAQEGPLRRRSLTETSAEEDNLLVVIERVLDDGAPSSDAVASAMAAAAALGSLRMQRGPLATFVPVLRRIEALGSTFEDIAPATLARFHLVVARSLRRYGGEGFLVSIASAVQHAQEAANAPLVGRAILERGIFHLRMSAGLEQARADAQQALVIARTSGDEPLEAWAEQVCSEILFRTAPEQALGHLRHALTISRKLGDVWLEAHAELTYAWILSELGDAKGGLRRYLRTERLCAQTMDAPGRAYALVGAAMLSQELGNLDEARAHFDASLAIARELGEPSREGYALAYRGFLHHERGDLESAELDYEAALPALAKGDRWTGSIVTAALGAIDAAHDRFVSARERFEEASLRARELADKTFGEVVEVYRGTLDVALANAALHRGDVAEIASHQQAAQLRIDAAMRPPSNSKIAASPAQRSTDVRTALRILRGALARLAPPADAVVLSHTGHWLRTPSGGGVDLSKSRLLRALLLRLVAEHEAHPGAALSREALHQALWPHERTMHKAALNRLFVAVTKLRQLGLKDVVESLPDGWRITPGTVIVRVEDALATRL